MTGPRRATGAATSPVGHGGDRPAQLRLLQLGTVSTHGIPRAPKASEPAGEFARLAGSVRLWRVPDLPRVLVVGTSVADPLEAPLARDGASTRELGC
jgi:hypothetical protein